MDKNTLNKIQKAENQADAVINKASKQAEKLEEKSIKELAINKEQFELDLEKQSNKIIQAKITIANKEAKAILDSNKQICDKLFEDSQEKMKKAIKLVIKKIGVSKWQ
ncbi:MAG: hypothetical protein KAG94_02275 [Clostridiales bacterium]|nr:hypothetical protein [Clostridiales bacterium]